MYCIVLYRIVCTHITHSLWNGSRVSIELNHFSWYARIYQPFTNSLWHTLSAYRWFSKYRCCCCLWWWCCCCFCLGYNNRTYNKHTTNNKIHDLICLFFVLTRFSWITSAGLNGRKNISLSRTLFITYNFSVNFNLVLIKCRFSGIYLDVTFSNSVNL